MKFSINIGLFALAATFQTIAAAPFAVSNQTSTDTTSIDESDPVGSGLGTPVIAHGCKCYYWKSAAEGNYGNKVIKVKCETVGKGVQVRGLSPKIGYTQPIFEAGQTVQTPAFQEWVTDLTDFRLVYMPSGRVADMGDCVATLKTEEHTIKNDYWVSMTCTNITPGLKAWAQLECLTGDELTTAISQPGTVESDKSECWLSSPDVRVMWGLTD